MKREHIHELNITRALAIIAVIMIHSTSTPVATLSSESSLFSIYVFLNIFSKFSVPAFIFLSGLVLFYNYIQKDFTKKMVINFYKKRITQIVIPYIFFSVFYYAVIQFYTTRDVGLTINALFSIEFLQKLLIGKAYTHLYYIFIIVQFYLLFPIFLYFLKKIPAISHHLLWIGFVLQWAFVFLNAELWQYPFKGSIAFSYILYFLMGAYIGIYFERYKKFLKPTKESFNMAIPIVWIVWIVASFYNIYLYYFVFSSQTYLVNSKVFELVFQIQSVTASIVILQLSFWIYDQWNKNIVNGLINLGALSFGVYLLHPFFLFIYRRIPVSGNSLLFHAWSIGGFFVALFLTWIVVILIGKYVKYHWIAFGPIPQKIPYKK